MHCLPSQHWSRRGAGDMRKRLWAAWAVVGAERRIYFSGDAGYSRDFADAGSVLGPFDLAAVPIGAYRPEAMMRPWHLDPEEAVRAGLELRARRLVPIHFGTFDLSDEPAIRGLVEHPSLAREFDHFLGPNGVARELADPYLLLDSCSFAALDGRPVGLGFAYVLPKEKAAR